MVWGGMPTRCGGVEVWGVEAGSKSIKVALMEMVPRPLHEGK